MKTVGGNPFQIAHPSRARRTKPHDWLLCAGALIGAAIFAMGMPSSAWASHLQPLATTVWVANGGAFNAGSVETFAAGSKKHTKPLYRNAGPMSLLQSFPGSAFFATDPTGVALTPDTAHVTITGEIISAALTYTPTANGEVPPETVIFGSDTALGTPAGDAYGPLPELYFVSNHQELGPLPASELYVGNIASTLPLPVPVPSSNPTPVVGATITEYPEGANGDQIPDEIIGGDPTVTFLYEPGGVFVDSMTAYTCTDPEAPPGTTASDLCDGTDEGATVNPVYTRRIWVAQPALGLITVYDPEASCALSQQAANAHIGVFGAFGPLFCAGDSLNPALQDNVLQQPPLGGIFPTTTDGLTPVADGGTSTDPTEPEFLAVAPSDSPVPQVYVTDFIGGYHNHGRVKIFNAFPISYCVAENTAGTACLAAINGFMYALPPATIGGRKTKLHGPLGITASPVQVVDGKQSTAPTVENLIVTNVNGNSILQFLSTDSGNVRPEAMIKGKKARMNQPAGIASIP